MARRPRRPKKMTNRAALRAFKRSALRLIKDGQCAEALRLYEQVRAVKLRGAPTALKAVRTRFTRKCMRTTS